MFISLTYFALNWNLQEGWNETIENNNIPSWLPGIALPWQRSSTPVCVWCAASLIALYIVTLYCNRKRTVCIFGLRTSNSPWTSAATGWIGARFQLPLQHLATHSNYHHFNGEDKSVFWGHNTIDLNSISSWQKSPKNWLHPGFPLFEWVTASRWWEEETLEGASWPSPSPSQLTAELG